MFFCPLDMKKNIEPLILEILETKKIKSQAQLLKQLAVKGLVTDQSNLSRTLRRLKIGKVNGAYCKDQPEQNILSSTLWVGEIQLIPLSPHFLVLKMLPGHAQSLAARLDQAHLEGLLATLAGDDTLLCMLSQDQPSGRVQERIVLFLQEKKQLFPARSFVPAKER